LKTQEGAEPLRHICNLILTRQMIKSKGGASEGPAPNRIYLALLRTNNEKNLEY